MAGNQKQKKKSKSKTSTVKTSSAPAKKRMSTSQLVFIVLGVLIILSMVISLVAKFAI